MPIFSSQLGKVESYNPEQSIKTMANHLRKIQEELEYRLMNLDSTNISEIDANSTSITLDGKPLKNVIIDNDKLSSLEHTVDGLYTTVSDQNLNISTLQQTASGIAAKVENQEGQISTLQQVAAGLQTQVSTLDGRVSTVTQTANGLQAAVENLQTGMGHMLKMDANGVYIVDQNGNAVTISGGQIDASTLTVNAANITGTLAIGRIPSSIARTSQIPGALSDLDDDLGLVTEDNVTIITENAIRTASISANQITSGTLNANYVNIKGLLKVLVGGSTYGWIGGTDMGSTAGAVLTGPSTMHGCMATNTGAKLVYDIDEHMIWVAADGCSSTSAMKVYSDRRLKEDICYEMDDAEAMFKQLRPCSFRMIKDKNHKKSWGFIAQDAISAAEEAGMDAEKLAMFGNSDGMHTIAYGEMTALNTHMIQKLMKRVAALEEART